MPARDFYLGELLGAASLDLPAGAEPALFNQVKEIWKENGEFTFICENGKQISFRMINDGADCEFRTKVDGEEVVGNFHGCVGGGLRHQEVFTSLNDLTQSEMGHGQKLPAAGYVFDKPPVS